MKKIILIGICLMLCTTIFSFCSNAIELYDGEIFYDNEYLTLDNNNNCVFQNVFTQFPSLDPSTPVKIWFRLYSDDSVLCKAVFYSNRVGWSENVTVTSTEDYYCFSINNWADKTDFDSGEHFLILIKDQTDNDNVYCNGFVCSNRLQMYENSSGSSLPMSSISKTNVFSFSFTDDISGIFNNVNYEETINQKILAVLSYNAIDMTVVNNTVNCSGGYTVISNQNLIYLNFTGKQRKPLGIYLHEAIINATGFHSWVLNSTGYVVNATYTGNTTTNSSFNYSSLNETDSNWLYLGAMLTIDNAQFYLLVLISLWAFFIFLFEDKGKNIYALCIVFLGLPLGIIISGIAYYNSYPFGYLISFIIILISFLIPAYSQYKNKKK